MASPDWRSSMLPNVLGIGVQRGGSTWLHDQLALHPEVYVPVKRKEIHYFDRHYEKGLNWYKNFFPQDGEAEAYRCVAEVTPMYIYDPDVPKRILDTLGPVKLIVILRDPVERAVSQYRLMKRQYNLTVSFREFLASNPDVIDRGYYSRQIRNYYQFFDRESFLFIRFEHIVSEPSFVLDAVAGFLGVSRAGFNEDAAGRVSNEGFNPRLGFVYALGKRIINYFRDNDMDYMVNFIKRLNLGVLAGKHKGKITVQDEDLSYLCECYRKEIDTIESMLELDLSAWRRGR